MAFNIQLTANILQYVYVTHYDTVYFVIMLNGKFLGRKMRHTKFEYLSAALHSFDIQRNVNSKCMFVEQIQ